MAMDCRDTRKCLEGAIDGRLSAADGDAVRAHLAACPDCAREEAGLRRAGEALRLFAAAKALEKGPQLDVLWTRVRAGIEEQREAQRSRARLRKWAWLPATVFLAVFALLFYPARVDRAPFHPSSFEVSVEDLESDAATVALVDRGEEFPRVIWIVEDGKS